MSNEKNAQFAVVRTAFHGGGVVSYHKTLHAAELSARRARVGRCCCGCAYVVPLTRRAQAAQAASWEPLPLLSELPEWRPDSSPYQLCR